jgi:hypothetical protein
MREVFADKRRRVSMPLPNHWHALATIWASRQEKTSISRNRPATTYGKAGKVEAARKYNPHGLDRLQSRSTPVKMKAIQLLRTGSSANFTPRMRFVTSDADPSKEAGWSCPGGR